MDRVNVFARWGITILIVVMGLYVALSPSLVYAPVPRVTLFCLVSFLPAILFGAEATSQFKLSLFGFVFTTTGAAAVALGTLLLLSHLAKPEQQIAVYRIMDEHRQPVLGLDRNGAVEVQLSNQGLAVTKFLDGNSMILIFPEQIGECDISVKPSISGPIYSGKVTYAGNRQSELLLGKDLTANR